MKVCAVEYCDRRARARGWCDSHYRRWQRTGDPGEGAIRPPLPDFCCILGCGRRCYARGMCELHHRRWRDHGDPFHERTYAKGPDAPDWRADDVGYVQVHFRLRRTKSNASAFSCVDCGAQAAEWAYDHSDPDERLHLGKYAYSTDMDRYSPMCRRCHRRMDCDPDRPWT